MNKELITALINVKKNLPEIKRTKVGRDGNRTFLYADLSDILSAITPLFSENGLLLLQPINMVEQIPTLETTIVHSSGDQIVKTLVLPIISAKPKDAGAIISYYRRYALNAMLGISSESDTELEKLNNAHEANNVTIKQTISKGVEIPGEFVIPFGRNKGQKISSISADEIENTIDYWESRANNSGKPLDGLAKEFIDACKQHLNSVQGNIITPGELSFPDYQ